MSIIITHTVSRPCRRMTAAVMAVLYMMILLSPLAPFAGNSAGSTGVVVRECSGDCTVCGCSPESRAANTCCCSKKRQQQAHLHDDAEADEPECCKKERAASRQTVIACGCPCDGGKHSALSTAGTSEVLPFHFAESFSIAATDTTFSNHDHRLTTRHGEPPTPPPKLV